MKPGRPLCLAVLIAVPLAAAGCGSRSVSLPENDPNHTGAVLFAQNCSGCHTLDAAGAQGSATKVRDRERVDGPNFNTRTEGVDQVLYAIRNGGFSGAIMPQNIVVGEDAQKVAEFLAAYAGKKKREALKTGEQPDTGGSGGAGAP